MFSSLKSIIVGCKFEIYTIILYLDINFFHSDIYNCGSRGVQINLAKHEIVKILSLTYKLNHIVISNLKGPVRLNSSGQST